MPPRKKTEPTAPSTMKELKDTLWKAADKLRGSLSASQYKDVILGLVFLKYVSDAFDERRETIRTDLINEGYDEDQIADLIDDAEEYQGYGVFLVPEEARWAYLSENAKGKPAVGGEPAKTIGALIDAAMDAVMKANPTLAGTLPRIYNRDNIDQRRLGELVDLFNNARFSRLGEHRARDLMGEVYEYFLGAFARAEGKRGGEFFTPPSVVKVIVEVLEPSHGRVYDPCCGSGGMFVQTEKFIHDHDGDTKDISVFGQESIEETWRLAKMNLAIHGIENNGLGARWGDTFARDQHADIQMDFVMANPPFNIKHWTRNVEDPRWKYGVPPANNANYAWIQHILSKLAPGGTAGVVMANGSLASNTNGEGDIRAAIVDADLVASVVVLPPQLFRSTPIPVCLWFFAKDKTKGKQGAIDRSGQVLFIDARNDPRKSGPNREFGFMVDRAERDLDYDNDIRFIGDIFHAWRGSESATSSYADVPGFCRSVTLAEIKAADYTLQPGRYVGVGRADQDTEPAEEKVARLTAELVAAFEESSARQNLVRAALERLQ